MLGFYGTSTPEPFLPDNRMYSPSKTPRGSPCFASSDGFSRSPSRTPQKSPVFSARQNAASESPLMVPKKPLFYSARRSLTMDVEKRAEHDLEDDFKPNPKFRCLLRGSRNIFHLLGLGRGGGGLGREGKSLIWSMPPDTVF